jgi:hypothetical protein
MGLQAIAAEPKNGSAVFPVDQDTGDMTTVRGAARLGVLLQRRGESIAVSSGSKTAEGLRGLSRPLARASATAAACILWFAIGVLGDKARCGEGSSRVQAFVASAKEGSALAELNARRDRSLLATQILETAVFELKPDTAGGSEKIGILVAQLTPTERSDAAPDKVAQAPQSALAAKTKQPPENEQEKSRAEALARALTSSLREELDAVRSAAEAAAIEQRQALDQERDRAEALTRELDTARIDSYLEAAQAADAELKQRQALEREQDRADRLVRDIVSLQAELDAARTAGPKVAQAAAAEVEQKQALEQKLKQERERAESFSRELASLRAELEGLRAAGPKVAQAAAAEAEKKQALEQKLKQERERAESLSRELVSLRAEFEGLRAAGPKVAQAAAAEVEKKQALEQKFKQERERAESLSRELASLRAELETSRAAGSEITRIAEAAKSEQELALGKQRYNNERLARELASARKEAEERSALLAAAHAEVLQVAETNRAIAAEQKLAFAGERDRADALARELVSVKNELDASNRRTGALNALAAMHPREPAMDGSHERMTESSSRTIEGNGRSLEQLPGDVVASTSGRSSASEPPRSQAQPIAGEAASGLDPKAAIVTERVTSASAASRPPLDEQRLLARANALLRQADISGARPLLEHALDRGSARAAFMLAETYDARVLVSWRARGIFGDPAKARVLYERAQAGGIEDAKKRIETLK